MKIAGVVTLYNPDENIVNNLKTYLPYVDVLYIVLNSEISLDIIEYLHGLNNVVILKMKENFGILEVVQKGQKAQTARYYEAVCANKKLLTNNHYIKELPFYDERYMKVFDDFSNIDIEWIKRREKIAYGYNGEFSPVKILDVIGKNM